MRHLTLFLISFLLLLSQSSANTKSDSERAPKRFEEIPKEWVTQQGHDVLLYAKYIESLGLKNISPYNVLYPHFKKRGKISNSIPPKHLWKNIATTLKVVDQLSTNLNAEIKSFLSIYRSQEYNRAIKGSAKSHTLTNKSVKVSFESVTTREVGAEARKLRSQGFFKGGVGVYSSFVYIDSGGVNVDW